MQNDEMRWFRVHAVITYEAEVFIQATSRKEAEDFYYRLDDLEPGKRLEEKVLDFEECKAPI